MLRHRQDVSWPILALLVGLIILSIRLPRNWEQIARPTSLAKKSHRDSSQRSLETRSFPLVQTSDKTSDGFNFAKTAGYIAARVETTAGPTIEVQASALRDTVIPGDVMSTALALTVSGDRSIEPGTETQAAKDRPLADPVKVAVAMAPGEVQSTSAGPEMSWNNADVVETGRGRTDSNGMAPPTEIKVVETQSVEGDSTVRVLGDVSQFDVNPNPASEPQLEALQSVSPRSVSQSSLEAGGHSRMEPEATIAVRLPSTAIPDPTQTTATTQQQGAKEGELATAMQPYLQKAEPQPVAAIPSPSVESLQDARSTSESDKAPSKADVALPEVGPNVASAPVKPIGRAWEEPTTLLGLIESLKSNDITKPWATETDSLLHRLGPAISVGAPETSDLLAQLRQSASWVPTMIPTIADRAVVDNLARAGQSLQRHVAVWEQIGKMGGLVAADSPVPDVDPKRMDDALGEIDNLTKGSAEGSAWRKFLHVDTLRDWSIRRKSADERVPRELAQQVLKRINQMSMSTHQRQFLASRPMAALNREMLRHTAEPVESNRLLQHIENYEKSGLPSDALVLAHDCQTLSVGSGEAQRELGERVEMHYRNANVRVAINADLLNRMMPKRDPEYAAVQDTVLGNPVHGQSLVASDLRIRMLPDPYRVRIALEVNGQVAALTRTTAGPATFVSDSESAYIARKPMEITLRGIRTEPTEVDVDNTSSLRSIATDFDHLPILGSVVRNAARSQHDQSMPAADAEVRQKIAAKAKERVDRETSNQIAKASKQLHDEVLGPMDALLLEPTLIAAETNEQRFSMRIRLAGADQLGAHTPRPQAPSDSLASLQIHESMLNNVLARLELDGQTLGLAELGERVSERLHRPKPKAVDPDQDDVKITFASKDALHVHCVDGRIEITLSIAKLTKSPRKFKDFQVRAFYRPEVRGRSVDLVRDGIVQLNCPRMSTGSQIALRGVFSKVFSQKEPVHVTPETFVHNPKLDGVVVTQLSIDDGWIGAAIGPQRMAGSPRPDARR